MLSAPATFRDDTHGTPDSDRVVEFSGVLQRYVVTIRLITSLILFLQLCNSSFDVLAEELSSHKPNHLSAVIAGTFVDGEEAETIGLDYEYRVNETWGVGGVVEHAFHPIQSTTILLTADIHIWRGLAIQTGPGIELENGDEEEGDSESFVYRVGMLYEFEISDFTLAPQFHLDFAEEHTSVITAIAIGFNF